MGLRVRWDSPRRCQASTGTRQRHILTCEDFLYWINRPASAGRSRRRKEPGQGLPPAVEPAGGAKNTKEPRSPPQSGRERGFQGGRAQELSSSPDGQAPGCRNVPATTPGNSQGSALLGKTPVSGRYFGWCCRRAVLDGKFALAVEYIICPPCRLGWVDKPYTYEPYLTEWTRLHRPFSAPRGIPRTGW